MSKFYITIFLIIFGLSDLFSNNDLNYMIKSYRLEKIEKSLGEKENLSQKQKFALLKYYENHPSGDKSKIEPILASIVLSKDIKIVNLEVLSKLKNFKVEDDTIIFRASFWKLYNKLEEKKLSNDYLIDYLKNLPQKADPISHKSNIEILKLYSKDMNFKDGIAFFENFSKEEQNLFFTPDGHFYYIKLLLKNKQELKALNHAIPILKEPKVARYTKRNINYDLFYIYSSRYYEKDISILGNIIPYFDKKQKQQIMKKYKLYNLVYEDEFSYVNVLRAVKELSDLKYLLKLAEKNSDMHAASPITISSIANSFLEKDKLKAAYKILKSYNGKPSSHIYLSYARYYQKKNKLKKYFKNLILSLSLNPYKIRLHDELITLLNQNFDKNQLLYWQYAVYKIPNVGIKGRLAYWYFIYLEKNQEIELLKKELRKYYAYMPGSYYIEEIYKRFYHYLEDPNQIEVSNIHNYIRYLSATGGNIKKELHLQKQNFNFMHVPQIYVLESEIKKIKSILKRDSFLYLSLQYLQIGQLRDGLNFFYWYAKNNNYSKDKQELMLIALGEYSKNYYLSVYYTKRQMKKLFLPDDMLLLPKDMSKRLYPRPHRKIVLENSRKYNVDENIIYAIMRQESYFRENAISSANAKGLMQVMEPTGREIVRNLKFSTSYSLYDPDVSIKLGTIYLNNMLKRNNQSLKWASIAYNGGPGNLRKWKRNLYNGDFNQFLELLPSQEARNYCRIISSNFYNYRNLKRYYNE